MMQRGLSKAVRLICSTCFVLSSPIGLVIGMAAFEAAGSQAWAVAGICNAFGLGMILLVGVETVLEALSDDEKDEKGFWSKLLSFFLIVVGAFMVFGLFIVHLQYHIHHFDHGDEHGGHPGH